MAPKHKLPFERMADEIRAAGDFPDLLQLVELGAFDESVTPAEMRPTKPVLVSYLRKSGLEDLAARVEAGEFDASLDDMNEVGKRKDVDSEWLFKHRMKLKGRKKNG